VDNSTTKQGHVKLDLSHRGVVDSAKKKTNQKGWNIQKDSGEDGQTPIKDRPTLTLMDLARPGALVAGENTGGERNGNDHLDDSQMSRDLSVSRPDGTFIRRDTESVIMTERPESPVSRRHDDIGDGKGKHHSYPTIAEEEEPVIKENRSLKVFKQLMMESEASASPSPMADVPNGSTDNVTTTLTPQLPIRRDSHSHSVVNTSGEDASPL